MAEEAKADPNEENEASAQRKRYERLTNLILNGMETMLILKKAEKTAQKLIQKILQIKNLTPDFTRYPEAEPQWKNITDNLNVLYTQAQADYEKVNLVIQEYILIAERVQSFKKEFSADGSQLNTEEKLDLFFEKLVSSRTLIEGWEKTLAEMWSVKLTNPSQFLQECFKKLGYSSLAESVREIDENKKLLQLKKAEVFLFVEESPMAKNLSKLRQAYTQVSASFIQLLTQENIMNERMSYLANQIELEEKKMYSEFEFEKKESLEEKQELKTKIEQKERDIKALMQQRDFRLNRLTLQFQKEKEQISSDLGDIRNKLINGVRKTYSTWFGAFTHEKICPPDNIEDLKYAERTLLTQQQNIGALHSSNSSAIREDYGKRIESLEKSVVELKNSDFDKKLKSEILKMIKHPKEVISDLNEQTSRLKKELATNAGKMRVLEEEMSGLLKQIVAEENLLNGVFHKMCIVIQNLDENIKKEEGILEKNCEKLGHPTFWHALWTAASFLSSLEELNDELNDYSKKCGRASTFCKTFLERFNEMIDKMSAAKIIELDEEIEIGHISDSILSERSILLEIVKAKYPTLTKVHSSVQDGILDYITIQDTLDDEEILRRDLEIQGGLAQKSWKNFWKNINYTVIVSGWGKKSGLKTKRAMLEDKKVCEGNFFLTFGPEIDILNLKNEKSFQKLA